MSEPKTSRYVDMPAGEIVKAPPPSLVQVAHAIEPHLSELLALRPYHRLPELHEEIKGALIAVVSKQLCESIDRHEKAASRLSMQLLWLNIILGVFTIAGTVLTIISLMK